MHHAFSALSVGLWMRRLRPTGARKHDAPDEALVIATRSRARCGSTKLKMMAAELGMKRHETRGARER